MHPNCVKAMAQASREFVDLNKLLVAAGAKAAKLCRVRHQFLLLTLRLPC